MNHRIFFITGFFLYCGYVLSQDTTIFTKKNLEKLNYTLISAAYDGDAKEVFELLEKGADVNTKTEEGVSALMYAAQGGHLQTVKILVANGADINSVPYSKETALLAAVKNNYEKIVEYLLFKGADPLISNNNGNQAIHYAVLYGYFVITDMLLYYNADIEAKTNDNVTPLMIAAFYQDYAITKLLIEKNANVNAVDIHNYTPLMFASQNGDFDIVQLLVQNNADIRKKNIYGLTALDIAIKNGHDKIAFYLIDKDSVGCCDNAYKLAVVNNRKAVADSIAKKGIKGKNKPLFSKLYFSYGTNFNLKSFMFETKAGIIESRYNIAVDVGITNSYWAKRIILQKEDGNFWQLWEKRHFVFLDIEKYLLFNSETNNPYGIFAGLRTSFTFGNYKGLNTKIDKKTLISPQIGIFKNDKHFKTKINYEYMNFNVTGISGHRINISFIIFFNFIKQQDIKKLNIY